MTEKTKYLKKISKRNITKTHKKEAQQFEIIEISVQRPTK